METKLADNLNDSFAEKRDSKVDLSIKKNETHIADCVSRWGGSASVALFDPSCQIFSTPNHDGIIGYRSESACAVVYGDPVCSWDSMSGLVKAFHDHCDNLNLRIVYVTASERFANWAMKDSCGALVQFCEELILNPQSSHALEGAPGRKLRNKVNRSVNAGIRVHEYVEDDIKIETEIEKASFAWLKARQGPQIYLANVHLFSMRAGKRWLYARLGDNIVGVLLLNQLNARGGWLINLLMATPEAPPGTSELLVIEALKLLKNEGCQFLTLGVVPASQIGKIIGIGALSTWSMRRTFKAIKWIFSLDARSKYWKKFQPKNEPSYLVFRHPHVGFREIVGVMRAMHVSVL